MPQIASPMSETNNNKHWYVVYSKPRLEAIAQENLERQQFETYLPRLRIQKRRHRRILDFIEPFFPRYLFVKLDPLADDWSPIRSTRGVVNLVKFEGIAREVPDSFINSLKANEAFDGLQQMHPSPWHKGDSIAIEDGPFAGYRCIYEADHSADRVRVLLDIIGKQTFVTLMKKDLQLHQFV